MRIGAQLFTMREFIQTERDMEFTFAKIAEMGYEIVQLSGVQNYNAKNVRAIADKNGLKIVLTHTPQDRVLNEVERVIEDHNILGADYIGIGSMPGKYRDPHFVHRFAYDYIPVAEKMKDAGKLFMYHNHDFELQRLPGSDKKLIEILMEDMPAELMGFTLDTAWVHASGASISTWIEKLKGRLPCVHLKDIDVRNRARGLAPVFAGNIEFEPVLKQLEEAGTKYALVEQDDCYDASPFDCMKLSFDNLSARGYK